MNVKNIEEKERCWTVYAHINKINGKCYIGITCQSPEKRWGTNGSRYLRMNQRGRYHQPKFAYAINKYGWDNFDHIILKNNLTKDEACQIEQEFISSWNTIENGYNMLVGGEINRFGMKNSPESKKILSEANKYRVGELNPFFGKHHTEETKRKMSEAHKGQLTGEKNFNYGKRGADSLNAKVFLQYDLNGELINKWQSGIDAARELDIDLSGIIKCCRNKYRTFANYIWRYEENPLTKEHLEWCRENMPKPVVQYTKDGTIIKIWNSAKAVQDEVGIHQSGIRRCCIGKQKTAGGYIWKYEDNVCGEII